MSTTRPQQRWRLRRGADGLRLDQLRSFGSEEFTWADLLQAPLAQAQVHVFYFPSRFDLPVDQQAQATLHVFGDNTSESTSVDFWNPRDKQFGEALTLFGLRSPPALVVATGVRSVPDGSEGRENLYCISFSDAAVLSDREQTAKAVNLAHEILMRCDRREIAAYIRSRKLKALLKTIADGAGVVRDQLLKLRPKFGLPGGASLELG